MGYRFHSLNATHMSTLPPPTLLCSQNDRGFQDGQSVVFQSYVKARIACLEVSNYKDVTKPGAVDYYYNVVSECGCGWKWVGES